MIPDPSGRNWPELEAAALRQGFRKAGPTEYKGPCPICRGTDRCRINPRGVYCRQCCPDGRDPKAVKALLDAVGLASDRTFDRLRRAPAFDGRTAKRPDRRRTVSGPPPAPTMAADRRAVQHAAALWTAAGPVRNPAETYLNERLPCRLAVWPPCLRWLPADMACGVELPDGAVGAIAYRFAIGDRGRAVQLEPLGPDGSRTPWQADGKRISRKTFGRISGAAFKVPSATDNGPVAVAEGPIDALAVHSRTGFEAWAAGGAGGLPGLAGALADRRRPIEIHEDGDGIGRTAAARLALALRRRHAECRIVPTADGLDPASRPAGPEATDCRGRRQSGGSS